MRQRISDNQGFTLIEILMVLALTVIIMGLVFGPLVNTFNLTRQAEVMVRVQDNARHALSLVSRDLSNAMYVYDNTRDPIVFPVTDGNSAPVFAEVYQAKVDLVLPRMRGYCPDYPEHTPGGVPRNNEATPLCQECGAYLVLKPVQPLAPDTHIVRYFIGLQDPMRPYANGYVNRLTEAGSDNTYVLYRAEFSVRDPLLFANPNDTGFNLSDPNFFYNSDNNPAGEPFCIAWKKISRPVVTLNDTDLVKIEYDNNGNPMVTPTVRFSPTAIYNDPMVPMSDENNDPENGDAPPTTYKATYGHWVLPYEVTLDPFDRELNSKPDYYFKAMQGRGASANDPSYDMCVYRLPVGSSASPVLMFNITRYEATRANSRFGVGQIVPSSVNGAQRHFTVDTVRGTANFAFPKVDIGASNSGNTAVSKIVDSDDVNDSGTDARRVFLNEPNEQIIGNATVVPWSVKVLAPSAKPGPSFGVPELYTRVSFLLYEPRPGQFNVDPYYHYDVNAKCDVASLKFHTTDTASGYWGLPIPRGDVRIYYEVQNNHKADSLRASYTTKSLMTIIMGIRVYNSSNSRPEVVELTNKVPLKNIKS